MRQYYLIMSNAMEQSTMIEQHVINEKKTLFCNAKCNIIYNISQHWIRLTSILYLPTIF